MGWGTLLGIQPSPIAHIYSGCEIRHQIESWDFRFCEVIRARIHFLPGRRSEFYFFRGSGRNLEYFRVENGLRHQFTVNEGHDIKGIINHFHDLTL